MTQTLNPPAQPKTPVTQLNSDQINRYKRHLILPEVGMEGQKKLLNAKVLCVGAGGLGCPISLYLAAAGVGTIGLADVDVVSPSNLQRQVLFGVSDVGVDKVKAAARRLRDLNPDVKVVEHKTIVNSQNVRDLRQPFGGTKASGTGREGAGRQLFQSAGTIPRPLIVRIKHVAQGVC